MTHRSKRLGRQARSVRTAHLLVIALLVLPHPVVPATITVDGQTGDPPGTSCDLVEAIENAEDDAATNPDCAAGSGDDEIVLTVDVVVTDPSFENADTGLPRIAGDNGAITIEGGNFTISRDLGDPDEFRLFAISPTGDLTLNEVTVTGGLVRKPDSTGGAIRNLGLLTLTHSTITGNTASAIGYLAYAYGGGIYNAGTATIINSTISGNRAEALQTTEMDVKAFGGGISNCSFFGCPGNATVIISYSTISGNTAEAVAPNDVVYPSAYAGGMYLSTGNVSITNSTFSGNTATAVGTAPPLATGGGILTGEADLILKNTTLSSNASSGNGIPGDAANLDYFGFGSGSVSIYDSLIGNPQGGGDNCAGLGVPGFFDGGNNLADDTSCETIPDTLTNLDSLLAANGGPTQTHALLSGSTAIDAAGTCGLATDQRGAPRVADACDSGSFEVAPCQAANGETFDIPDGTMVPDEQIYETCSRITLADVDVFSSGHLILRTAGAVEIGNGFEVDGLAARLTVEIDSSIFMPEDN